jgi:COP9 signalosome complex subunit 3
MATGSSAGAEKIISLIMNDGEDKLDHLQTELCKCQDMLAKIKDKNQFETSITLLNPETHTLGMIHILQIISSQTKFDKAVFLQYTTLMIQEGSRKQIKVDPKRFAIVCKKFVEICRELATPMRAIRPMMLAIQKIGVENHLTPQHTLLFMACIHSKCYHAAIPYLNNFVYLVDEKLTGIKSDETRLYYYYGGVCYIALKKWKKAIQFFETVISAPAVIASAIMIEGYKKYVLASLIYKGKVKELPKYVNPAVSRSYKQYCGAYDELATSFATRSFEMVIATITQYVELFIKENHMGLVSQVRSSLIQQNILQLPDVFATITFEGLKEHVGSLKQNEIEALLVKLVETNDFKIKIDQKNKYISFGHDGETYDDDETVNYLRDHIQKTIDIHRHLAKVDRSIEKDEKYIQKTLKQGGGNDERPDSGVRGGASDFMMEVEDYESFSNPNSGFGFM